MLFRTSDYNREWNFSTELSGGSEAVVNCRAPAAHVFLGGESFFHDHIPRGPSRRTLDCDLIGVGTSGDNRKSVPADKISQGATDVRIIALRLHHSEPALFEFVFFGSY